jgi:hypothetical protein
MGVILRILGGQFGGFILGAVGAVFLGLLGLLWLTDLDRDDWRKLAGKRLGELQQCRSNVAALDGALSLQNAAVNALKAEAEKRKAESDKALKSARSTADDLRRKAGRVLLARPGADQCASADALILDSVS